MLVAKNNLVMNVESPSLIHQLNINVPIRGSIAVEVVGITSSLQFVN